MLRKLKITYGSGLTINKSNYENEKPLYSQTTEVELNDGETFDEKEDYNRLKAIVDPLVKDHYDRAKLSMAGVRIRIKDGKKYPSVTSILNPVPFQCDEDYSIRGTEIHRLVGEFIREGVWLSPAEPLTKLTYEEIAYKKFFEENKDRLDFKKSDLNIEVFNETHIYSGEIDIVCGVDGIKTLVDVKTGVKYDWLQLCAYWKALGDKEIKQLAIFDLKKGELKTVPVSDDKARSAWESFLKKRGAFEAIYSL